jgi:hypothetical protein
MSAPVRIELSRAKGFNLQYHSRSLNGLEAVSVARGRGKKWGNPFKLHNHQGCAIRTHDEAVRLFRNWIETHGYEPDIRRELRGRNLACWCAPGAPCHADVLIEIANRPTCEAVT